MDDDSHTGELDDAKREKELGMKEGEMPIVIYDPNIKEGKIGFFSSDSEGLEVKDLLL